MTFQEIVTYRNYLGGALPKLEYLNKFWKNSVQINKRVNSDIIVEAHLNTISMCLNKYKRFVFFTVSFIRKLQTHSNPLQTHFTPPKPFPNSLSLFTFVFPQPALPKSIRTSPAPRRKNDQKRRKRIPRTVRRLRSNFRRPA